MTKPLMVDLFSGLGGWAEGGLAEGYDVVGFDIERHEYGQHRYPAQLVIQDVLTLHGSQFKEAALIVASPPCQEFSYMAMPWTRAKAKAAAIRADETGKMLADLTRLFDACFRIQKEASIAAGRHIPMVVENVQGAIPWVGRSRWNFGSFHLWGDVPALMPSICRGQKVPGFRFDGGGRSFQSSSVSHIRDAAPHTRHPLTNPSEYLLRGPLVEGRKGASGKSAIRNSAADLRPSHGNSPGRKFASAMIAKIPLPLSRHIAATYRA